MKETNWPRQDIGENWTLARHSQYVSVSSITNYTISDYLLRCGGSWLAFTVQLLLCKWISTGMWIRIYTFLVISAIVDSQAWRQSQSAGPEQVTQPDLTCICVKNHYFDITLKTSMDTYNYKFHMKNIYVSIVFINREWKNILDFSHYLLCILKNITYLYT